MKISNILITLIFTISMLLFACDNDENLPPPDPCEAMWDCHHQMVWDSLNTKDALIGEWEWEYISCFWSPENANNEQFDGLTVEFKADNTLEVKENGQITQTSNWKVVKGRFIPFTLDVDPTVFQLLGIIVLCNGRVEFSDSYRDGCDNCFRRK
jgi:hypothetical protein